MNKKRVLFLAEELRIGGAESYFYSLENNIDRSKYDFYSMAVNGEQHKKLSHPEMYYEYNFSFFDRYRKAKVVCAEKEIDVIHVNSLRLAFVAAAIKKKQNVKVIYTRHNLTILEKKSTRLYAWFLNSCVNIVNVICNTERDALLEIGVKKEKIKVIYNGIQIDKFPYKRQTDNSVITVGILARLSHEKNHKLFLSIAKQLHEKMENTQFFIGGDGPEKNGIIEEINNNGMNNYVKMCGYVKSNDFLAKIDYSVLVSEREAFPISIIEAMAVGAIVVAKDIGGIKELIDDRVGYLVQGDNAEKFVDALMHAITNDKIEEMRLNARKKAEQKFSFNTMLSEIENMYIR